MTRPGRLRAVATAVAATLLLTAGCTARGDDPPPAATPSATARPEPARRGAPPTR
ncbi:hypothetical protein JNW90_07785 [Micromonospora sp. STR1s_5]|nr:hypothetical protein [Micromonospora sp. STR1s_5]